MGISNNYEIYIYITLKIYIIYFDPPKFLKHKNGKKVWPIFTINSKANTFVSYFRHFNYNLSDAEDWRGQPAYGQQRRSGRKYGRYETQFALCIKAYIEKP
jgi:hypothetical protein